MGRNLPVDATAGFSAWQLAKLCQLAELGQQTTLALAFR
jgi:hypothetical protein